MSYYVLIWKVDLESYGLGDLSEKATQESKKNVGFYSCATDESHQIVEALGEQLSEFVLSVSSGPRAPGQD